MGESPEGCVRGKVKDELGLDVEVGPLLDAWVYETSPGTSVLVLVYGCFAESPNGPPRFDEHSEVRTFDPEDLDGANLPDGYRRSTVVWSRHPALLERPKG